MRSALPRSLATCAIAAAVLTLSSCGQPTAEPTENATESAAASDPAAAPGMMLSDAIVRLPAVSGSPGVAYFTLTQATGAPRKLVAVHVEGFGRAELHQSTTDSGVSSMQKVTEIPIESGKSVEFKPGGFHVMLFDSNGALKAGGQVELTITLDNGDKVTSTANVEAPGGEDMAGMGHM
jgi:hypothetical protein